jgi:hypothetical protein
MDSTDGLVAEGRLDGLDWLVRGGGPLLPARVDSIARGDQLTSPPRTAAGEELSGASRSTAANGLGFVSVAREWNLDTSVNDLFSSESLFRGEQSPRGTAPTSLAIGVWVNAASGIRCLEAIGAGNPVRPG